VPVVTEGKSDGVLRGKGEIGRFFGADARSRPIDLVRWHRSDTYFSVGTTLIWEYPRAAPEGDQVEIVEVMEITDRLILHHRIYWGWKGCLLIAPRLAKV
jgi:steroid Delta-isomerase